MIQSPSFASIRNYVVNEFNLLRMRAFKDSLIGKIRGRNNKPNKCDEDRPAQLENRTSMRARAEPHCLDQALIRPGHDVELEQRVFPLKDYLRLLWINIRLFIEADKWEHIVSLKVGDSHIVSRMEDIESRWRADRNDVHRD